MTIFISRVSISCLLAKVILRIARRVPPVCQEPIRDLGAYYISYPATAKPSMLLARNNRAVCDTALSRHSLSAIHSRPTLGIARFFLLVSFCVISFALASELV